MDSCPATITAVTTSEDLSLVQELLREYWQSFGFDPAFQDFASEVNGLPGKYAPPRGRLALARIQTRPAGCIALRPLDERRAEVKRLYVRSEFRGRHIGPHLLIWLVAEAGAAGYRELVCDTMPSMSQALRMYQSFGFQQVEPYAPNPTPGAIYLSLVLGVQAS